MAKLIHAVAQAFKKAVMNMCRGILFVERVVHTATSNPGLSSPGAIYDV